MEGVGFIIYTLAGHKRAIEKCIYFSSAHVLLVYMEGVGFITYTVAGHKRRHVWDNVQIIGLSG